MKDSWNWTRDDLDKLIGQSESLRLEFKSSKLLDSNHEELAQKISKEVSAFANTEGGTLIIGIEDDKEGKALEIKGTDPEKSTNHKLQQIIESNISPPLSGIRFNRIFTNIERSSCVYVVYIPAGTTAYQAKDKRYYGRSEYESKPLHDHEVRLRMLRNRYPEATLNLKELSRTPIRSENEKSGHIEQFCITFGIYLKNVGEINIREFKCWYFMYSKDIFHSSSYAEDESFSSILVQDSISFKDGWKRQNQLQDDISDEAQEMKINVYPGDTFLINKFSVNLCNLDFNYSDICFDWKLYLPDRPPSEGKIILGF
jgi:hypothetical protein